MPNEYSPEDVLAADNECAFCVNEPEHTLSVTDPNDSVIEYGLALPVCSVCLTEMKEGRL